MDRRILWVVALAAASLTAAYLLKEPCISEPWEDEFQYRHYCYTDLIPLWYGHGVNDDQMPYVEHFNEYPVLTGFFEYTMGIMTESLYDYMVLSSVVLLAAGGLTSLALWRTSHSYPVLAAWTLAPTVPVHGLTNWDLLPLAFAAWGWLMWRRQRVFAASLLFGLGAATKLYPGFFLPFLLLDRWRVRDKNGSLAVIAGGFLGAIVPNLLVAIADFDGWLATWTFHADRHPDFETPWQALIRPLLDGFIDYDWGATYGSLVGRFTLVSMAAGLGWFSWRVYQGGRDPLVAGTLLVLVFALVNKVYSPQYTLWILPLLLILRARWTPVIGYIIADTANFFVRYNLFRSDGGASFDADWTLWSRVCVVLRWAFLVWAGWGIAKKGGFMGDESGESAVAEPAAAPE